MPFQVGDVVRCACSVNDRARLLNGKAGIVRKVLATSCVVEITASPSGQWEIPVKYLRRVEKKDELHGA